MDPPYQPANITFDSNGSNNNSSFNPNFDARSNSPNGNAVSHGNGGPSRSNIDFNNNSNNNNNGNGMQNQNQNPINPQHQSMNMPQNQNGVQNQGGFQNQNPFQDPAGYNGPQNQNSFQNGYQGNNGPMNQNQTGGYQNNNGPQNQNGYQYPNDFQNQSAPQYHSRNVSGQSTRTNTWLNTPVAPYPPNSNGQQGYFPGPIDANGYPVDVKGKQPYVEERSVQPTPAETPRDSIDVGKEKAEAHAVPHDPHKKDPNQPFMSFGQRIRHFTWAWYTLTMATGGISTLIAIQPHRFPGLITIGAVFYVVNLIFFASLNAMMILRFTKFPGTFKESVMHEREALFLGPFFLSVATIITGTQKYVVESYETSHPMRGWIVTTMAIAFWAYVFVTFCLASFQYSYLFAAHTYPLNKFMPSWLLPIFPIMLGGTIASVIAKDQPVSARMPILVGGLACQGLGFTVCILMYAHYIGRLMQVGYPNREHRGAMFIGVGPPSFTALAFIGMANALPDDFDLQGDGLVDAKVIRTMAIVSAIFLWALAMWFFMIALVAVLHSRPEYFHLGWWAMVFPNTGFIIATINIGNSLKDEIILFVANGLTIAVLIMWAFVLYHNIRAVIVVDIMYPGRDEDVED